MMKRPLSVVVFLWVCYASSATEWTQDQLDVIASVTKRQKGVARIIRGKRTEPGRYPYMVSLTQKNRHKCGGTLIAPDLVLTANHCVPQVGAVDVGRYNISNNSEEYETFVFEEVVRHPRYIQQVEIDVDEHDYAILKLYGTTENIPPIKLNRDPSIPVTAGQELHVMGWGRPTVNGTSETSDVLREAQVYYIPNKECRNIVSGNITLDRNVFDGLTLCAADFDERDDSCTGDSGGPLVLQVDGQDDEVQVAVISYGFGCAHPELPGIYARLTHVQDWIDENVCRMSLNPPSDFPCEERSASTEPDLTGELVEVRLEFRLDLFAEEAGWILQSPNQDGINVTYAYQPLGSFANETESAEPAVVNTMLKLPNNRPYTLTLLDSFGDGYGNGAGVTLFHNDDNTTIVQVEPQPFRHSLSTDFVLGVLPTLEPTASPAPTTTNMPSQSPTVTPPFVTLEIVLDKYSEETGWFMEALVDVDDPVLLEQKFPGTYADQPSASISERITLLAPTVEPITYRFVMTDNERDGICCSSGFGSYRLWLGLPQDGVLLAEGGDFVFEEQHVFVLDANGRVATSTPSAAPTKSASPSANEVETEGTTTPTQFSGTISPSPDEDSSEIPATQPPSGSSTPPPVFVDQSSSAATHTGKGVAHGAIMFTMMVLLTRTTP